jgi:MFS transporter, NRE family, putaive nickel resistance protein
MNIFQPFKALKEPLFAKLYLAQIVSLIGDSCTWIGVALLAFEFGGAQSAKILATALTLRVAAFIVFGSYAGVLADRFNRKYILILTNLGRMFIVFSLVFVTAVWQLYLLIFILNIFNAFFSPAYKASIPQLISNRANYGNAITLSNATWQLLGMLGPGLAGGLAIWFGSRQLFFFDAFSFLLSSAFVLMIPMVYVKKEKKLKFVSFANIWADVAKGTKLLFKNTPIRFALLIELIAAIAGAQILVNTVGQIKGSLLLTNLEYGWVMTAFGIGATIAAFLANIIDRSGNKTILLLAGAFMLAISVSLASFASFGVLLILWVIAGLGQSFTELPSQILIAENIELGEQGKVYGSHFAWSHLWWAIGYPIAGFTGIYFKSDGFLIGGLFTLFLLGILYIYRKVKK